MTILNYFRPIKNIKIAVQAGREYWAQRKIARQTNDHNDRAKARTSRRDFLKACVRAATVPAGIVVGAPLAYYLLCEKPTTKPSPTPSPTIPKDRPKKSLKDTALALLQEIKENEYMSFRYQKFIAVTTKLLEEDKIIIRHANILKATKALSIYSPQENVILIDPSISPSDLKSSLIYNLFFAYFDYLAKKPTKVAASHVMAHAYLAQADYRFQLGYKLPDTWLTFKEVPDLEEFPAEFNIPARVVKKCQDMPPRSTQYDKAIEEISQTYLFVELLIRLNKANYRNVLYIMKKAKSLPRERFIRHLQAQREKAKAQIEKTSHKSINAKRSGELDKFITISYLLAIYFYQSNRREKALAISNDTLNRIQDIYKSATDISRLGRRLWLNGIH